MKTEKEHEVRLIQTVRCSFCSQRPGQPVSILQPLSYVPGTVLGTDNTNGTKTGSLPSRSLNSNQEEIGKPQTKQLTR